MRTGASAARSAIFKAGERPAAVEVRLATRADRDERVRLFHAIDVHYWGDAARQGERLRRFAVGTSAA
jgi:hypothetical protein